MGIRDDKKQKEMDTRSQRGDVTGDPENHTLECVWMLAGVVDYRLCDLEYDCDNCPFDRVISEGSHKHDSRIDYGSTLDRATLTTASRDAVVNPSQLPAALFYHPAHIWARVEEGGSIRAGLDDFAQRLVGRIYSVMLPHDRSSVRRGEACWRVAHQAGETALVSPISGVLRRVNDRLAQTPSLLNRDPYGEGWALIIEPTNLEDSLKALLYGSKALEWHRSELAKLYKHTNELLSEPFAAAGVTLPDGGLRKDFMNELDGDQIRRLIGSFLPLSPEEGDLTRDHAVLKQKGR